MKNSSINTLEVDGFQLDYSIEGTGIPTIVIGSSLYYPRTFSKSLRSSLKMIFMDHRGFGRALRHFENSDFELDKLVGDIEELRRKLELKRFVLMGHSGHALIALEYAKKYPEHVSQLILIAQSPDGGPETFSAADKYFQESVCPERKALLAKNLETLETEIAKFPQNAFIVRALKFGPMIWYQYDYDASALWKDVTVIPEMFNYVWGQVFRNIDINDGLDAFDKPVLLMLGRYDYWNPPHLWEPFREKFKDLTIRIFEKSGHTPQLEEAEYFNKELLDWLT
jgi:proline iminopeptidase